MNDQDFPVFDAKAFDDWANSYDADINREAGFPFEGFSAVMNEIIRCAAPQPGMHILDLGTGTGELAARFAGSGCRVIGTDFSPEMLKMAQQKYPFINFQFQDLLQPWPSALSGKYNRIVSAYVFHHFPLQKKVELVQEMGTHLEPDGQIVIGDLSFGTSTHLNEARQHYGEAWDEELYWVKAEALPALKQAGFHSTYKQISYCAGVYCISPFPG